MNRKQASAGSILCEHQVLILIGCLLVMKRFTRKTSQGKSCVHRTRTTSAAVSSYRSTLTWLKTSTLSPTVSSVMFSKHHHLLGSQEPVVEFNHYNALSSRSERHSQTSTVGLCVLPLTMPRRGKAAQYELAALRPQSALFGTEA